MSFLQRQLEDPVRFRRVKRVFYVVLGLIIAAEIATLLFSEGHAHFKFEDFPAWGSLYGFISCVVIVIGSKWIGKLGLMRREDHYDD